MVAEVEHTAPIGKSHHDTLIFKFCGYKDIPKLSQKKFKFDQGDYDQIRQNLVTINWENMFQGKSLDEQWLLFKNIIQTNMENCIPKTSGKPPKPGRPPWMNEDVLKKVKKKKVAYQRYKATKEGRAWDDYARARNEAKWACRQAVRDMEAKIAGLSKTNPKSFFRYANKNLKTKSTIPDLVKPDGTKTKSDKEKAELLNDFFSSVFTNEDTNNVPTIEMKDLRVPYTEIEVNEDIVKKKLSKIKTNKSPGMDGMHPRVLRELHEELAKPISMLINQTLQTGSLPQDWRDDLVTPIYKKEKKTQPCNYRPVSLTSLICKTAEILIRNHMINHLSDNCLLTDHQHGFVPKNHVRLSSLNA